MIGGAHSSHVHWGDVATWVGAAASGAAVFVALWVAVFPQWKERRNRPALVVEFGETEPFERVVRDPADRPVECRLRLGIRNEGRTTARRVRVTIERWWSATLYPDVEWMQNPIDPVLAEWVGWGVHDTGADAFAIDVPAGASALCEVLTWRSEARDLVLSTGASVRGGPFGEQRMALAVTCDNAEGASVVLSTTVHDGAVLRDAKNIATRSPMHSVKLTEAPEPEKVLPIGLGGLYTEPPDARIT